MRVPSRSCLEVAAQLAVACQGLTVRVDQFLEQIFFNEATGRALILQPAGAFGYFYLRTEAFDDATQRQQEIKALVDLMVALASLRAAGWIAILRGIGEPDQRMHFVGSLFEKPVPCKAHVILNAKGDFSFQPEAIQDANNNVIYKGVRLDGDFYALVQDCIGGLAYATHELLELLDLDAACDGA